MKNSDKLPWIRVNPNEIYGGEEEELTEAVERRRRASGIWSEQVDAAVVNKAEARVDGGGGARVLGRREEEDKTKRPRGESERDPRPYL